MSTYSKDMPVCATCDRWGGSRDPGRLIPSYTVWITDAASRGMCYGGAFSNMPMLPAASCSKHEKWNVLK